MVRGEGFLDTPLLHRKKRNAVGQRPLSVGALGVEFTSVSKPLAGGRKNLHVGLLPQELEQAREAVPVFRPAQGVANFSQDKLGGKQRPGRMLAEGARVPVELVRRIEQSQEVN